MHNIEMVICDRGRATVMFFLEVFGEGTRVAPRIDASFMLIISYFKLSTSLSHVYFIACLTRKLVYDKPVFAVMNVRESITDFTIRVMFHSSRRPAKGDRWPNLTCLF